MTVHSGQSITADSSSAILGVVRQEQ
jgi:hypothetical protein